MTKPESDDDLEKAMKTPRWSQPAKRGRGRPKGAVNKKPKDAAAQPGTPDLRAWVGGMVPDDHHQH